MPNKETGAVQTWFWMVHYALPPMACADAAGEPEPRSVGTPKFVVTYHRNAYGRHAVGFRMPRDDDRAPDPAHFRGAAHCRNLITGFYADAAEADRALSPELWARMRREGAVYAELHAVKLDVAAAEAVARREAA